MNKRGQEFKALIWGFILLFVFGGLLPLMLSDFSVSGNSTYNNYTQPIKGVIQNGFTFSLQGVLGGIPFLGSVISSLVGLVVKTFNAESVTQIGINPFTWLGSGIQNFFLTLMDGYSIMPPVIGIPLLIIIISSIFIGLVFIVVRVLAIIKPTAG